MNPIHYKSHVLPDEKVKCMVRNWMEEDTPNFDYGGIVVGNKTNVAKLWMKSPGMLAGIPFFIAIFKELDCEVSCFLEEGKVFEEIPKRELIAEVRGATKNILLGERIALNCLSRASGVATTAHQFLLRANTVGWHGKVAGTRKTTPGFRLVEKYALMIAGADTHRYNLSSMVMLKDNHIWACGSIKKAVETVKPVSGFSMKIEVECQSLEEGLEAAGAGADVVMFDNFSSEDLHQSAKTLKECHPNVIVEASGGITLENFTAYCGPNVDIISTSKVVQGYPAVDFSLKIVKDDK